MARKKPAQSRRPARQRRRKLRLAQRRARRKAGFGASPKPGFSPSPTALERYVDWLEEQVYILAGPAEGLAPYPAMRV